MATVTTHAWFAARGLVIDEALRLADFTASAMSR
jgi:hypothetical protein